MRTEELIVLLAADVRPVRPLEAPLVGFGRWAVAAVASAATAVWVFGARDDLAALFAVGPWTVELTLVVAAGVMAGVAAQLSGVPGAAGTRAARAGALATLGAWGLVMMTRLATAPAPLAALLAEPAHAACAARIVVIATVPAAMAWWQLRRAAALQPGWSAVLAATAALATAAAATQLICPLDQAAHAITWHLLPVAVIATAAGFIGSRARRLAGLSPSRLVAP